MTILDLRANTPVVELEYRSLHQVGEGADMPLENTGKDADYLYCRSPHPVYVAEIYSVQFSGEFLNLSIDARRKIQRWVFDNEVDKKYYCSHDGHGDGVLFLSDPSDYIIRRQITFRTLLDDGVIERRECIFGNGPKYVWNVE